MPLQENPNLANINGQPVITISHKSPPRAHALDIENYQQSAAHVMNRTFSRSRSGSPREIRLRAWKVEKSPEAPQLSLKDVDLHLNMDKVNGQFQSEISQDNQSGSPLRLGSSCGDELKTVETSTPLEPTAWSSAVGHASTGKSGRVIERLQGDIDRLRREKQLLKVKFEESEKANENLSTRNQYLQDRNSNYEQFQEANLRQLERKDRLVEDVREDLRREKEKTAYAQETARAASANEEHWREKADQARHIATQKETEYDTIVACRKLENDRYQNGIDNLKERFELLLRQRQEDGENYKKLEVVAEQQKQTISQLEDLTKRLNANFKAYRTEIDTAIAGMRDGVTSNDSAITTKLEEMHKVTGEMRWVMNVDKQFNQRPKSSHARQEWR